ncbi:hypothetical protein N5C55_02735 [Pseudomonas otitidis]|uniref:hypothetical protein n=1 Tax=Metapseudomonas otitidis TaxID=319939 RepID=UPI00244BAE67|nr:hypothetical protein [Pseudomonas otitidis]MDH1104793.1 hypothetical protein [Pseudomonas otitidis]MDH1157080.1 hypothetical protein [Pseudomonas otitidis]MDH1164704.1 hypothetical protein [Pseudomonas otitidis]
MRERPILFAGPMVRAILNGEKTVTRRLMKPQPTPSNMGGHSWPCPIHQTMLHVEQELQNGEGIWGGLADSACPHGAPGDRLWVRETFATLSAGQYEPVKPAYGYGQEVRFAATDPLADCDVGVRGYPWRPSIHMPRWASRILLEITAVRVERLQDISDEQARAEGLRWHSLYKQWGGVESHPASRPECPQWRWYEDPITAFRQLWESINGAGSWDANPWVWVVEFKRITP